MVLGDLNDSPDSDPLLPLLSTELRDVSEHSSFTDFEFRADRGKKGISTYKLGNDSNKIDTSCCLLLCLIAQRMQVCLGRTSGLDQVRKDRTCMTNYVKSCTLLLITMRYSQI